jgi:hypothetical protein
MYSGGPGPTALSELHLPLAVLDPENDQHNQKYEGHPLVPLTIESQHYCSPSFHTG